ncbi:N-acetyl-gamma-glutamyl-phosphate reductase [Shimazuella sp. AN120528]|uniref:N-acetyl-gamma-glutamyl-phosphate reductase n=1 Tax=Shimazuella soli TaxID=1892854 RepID=UPI001F0E5F62|nr:N-acetyl-gamma-glutamyl-phosphate reductase [Shimazuella soli]
MKVAVVGASGYGGVELIRLLEQHPYFEIGAVFSSSQPGERLSSVYPHLESSLIFEELSVDSMCDGIEVVFFATPPGVSSRWIPELLERGICAIDLSGDFRLADPKVYESWYQKPAASSDYLDQAVYGLSEWFQNDLRHARLISNPGCYPTATLLALAPLLQEKIIDPASIIIDAKSGVTGAGRSVHQGMLFSEINENVRPYKVDRHQHVPEIEQYASLFAETEVAVSFVPQQVPMSRGILVSIYAGNMNNYTNRDLYNLYHSAYEQAPFVRIRGQQWPETKFVQGSNYCDLGFHVGARTGRIILLSAIDNLMKGAAGQAIQNANIRFGFPETAGLLFSPLYP